MDESVSEISELVQPLQHPHKFIVNLCAELRLADRLAHELPLLSVRSRVSNPLDYVRVGLGLSEASHRDGEIEVEPLPKNADHPYAVCPLAFARPNTPKVSGRIDPFHLGLSS